MGIKLNHSKTKLLSHPKSDHTALKFLDGSVVPATTQVKYLGSGISWIKLINPFHTAFDHRLGLTEEAFKSYDVWFGTVHCPEKPKSASTTPPLLLFFFMA